ncbi:MAG: serine/threonine-protein kinase, partial [Bacteroidota bacterium]
MNSQQAAMKVLTSSSARTLDVDEMRKEFSILVNLSHPNLVRVFDFGTVLHSSRGDLVGRQYYTMEFLRGKDSLSYFSAKPLGRDKVELLENLLLQTLSVLEYVHQKAIIHYDIKPQNLILDEVGEQKEITVKLTDFGFSAARFEALEFPVRGTLEYAAPEILQGFQVDTRLDLYSLGITMYHLWEGRCPFEASEPVELVKKVLAADLRPLTRISDCDSILPEIIETLCRKSADDRYRSALQVLLMFSSTQHAERVREYLGFVRRPSFVGRQKERGIIEQALESLEREQRSPGMVAVVGAEGMGKSELLKETMRGARGRGMLGVEIGEEAAKHPFASILPVLRNVEMEVEARGKTARLPGRKQIS